MQLWVEGEKMAELVVGGIVTEEAVMEFDIEAIEAV